MNGRGQAVIKLIGMFVMILVAVSLLPSIENTIATTITDSNQTINSAQGTIIKSIPLVFSLIIGIASLMIVFPIIRDLFSLGSSDDVEEEEEEEETTTYTKITSKIIKPTKKEERTTSQKAVKKFDNKTNFEGKTKYD